MTPPPKKRLDQILVDRGLFQSRARAQAAVMEGKVKVEGRLDAKSGDKFAEDVSIELLEPEHPYVSRGGVKLAGALDHFKIDPSGWDALDIGASTGGFTDCLLQGGAARVFAVDVGTNQLDWKLRRDPRVVSMEKTNARYLRFEQLGTRVELVTMDVSFISATLILPVLPPLLEPTAELLVLVKPQFEVGRGQVGKGGIVREQRLRDDAVTKVSRKLLELGFSELASTESALPGAEGSREYFVHALWRKSG